MPRLTPLFDGSYGGPLGRRIYVCVSTDNERPSPEISQSSTSGHNVSSHLPNAGIKLRPSRPIGVKAALGDQDENMENEEAADKIPTASGRKVPHTIDKANTNTLKHPSPKRVKSHKFTEARTKNLISTTPSGSAASPLKVTATSTKKRRVFLDAVAIAQKKPTLIAPKASASRLQQAWDAFGAPSKQPSITATPLNPTPQSSLIPAPPRRKPAPRLERSGPTDDFSKKEEAWLFFHVTGNFPEGRPKDWVATATAFEEKFERSRAAPELGKKYEGLIASGVTAASFQNGILEPSTPEPTTAADNSEHKRGWRIYSPEQDRWLLSWVSVNSRPGHFIDWRLCAAEYEKKFGHSRTHLALRQRYISFPKTPVAAKGDYKFRQFKPEEKDWLRGHVRDAYVSKGMRPRWMDIQKTHSTVWGFTRSMGALSNAWFKMKHKVENDGDAQEDRVEADIDDGLAALENSSTGKKYGDEEKAGEIKAGKKNSQFIEISDSEEEEFKEL
ncbi:hypothetical protein RUND412_005835 [Rhizina undulata]